MHYALKIFKHTHTDEEDKVTHVPDEQVPISTDPGQILHIRGYKCKVVKQLCH